MNAREMARHAALLLAMLAVSAGCRHDARAEGEVSEASGRSAQVPADPNALDGLKTPNIPGRIIYDAPVDLSYASAKAKRPDLVPRDTGRTRPDTGVRTRRDTTAGDAAANTSGSASQRRRP